MMVEDITTAEGGPGLAQDAEPKTGFAAFASSRQGRIVLGVVGVFVLLAVLMAVLFLFVLRPGDNNPADSLVPPAGSVSKGTGAPATAEESATPPSTKPLSSTFVFRDIFEPSVKPSVVSSSSAGGSGGTGGTGGAGGSGGTDGSVDGSGTPQVPDDTLLLQGVSTSDGVAVATFVWNGQTYQASAGERLGDTPWQVVEISGNTVVMMYGDSRVTLSVGQGISK